MLNSATQSSTAVCKYTTLLGLGTNIVSGTKQEMMDNNDIKL